MAVLIEDSIPVVKYQGLNTNKAVALGSTLSVTGAVTMASTLAVTGALSVTGAQTFTGAITPTGGVASAGGFSTSPRCMSAGGFIVSQTTDGTDITFVTTETYISEVYIPSNVTVTGIAIFNGSSVAGNVQVALANSAGTVVANAASAAQSGTDAYQLVPFSSTYAAVGPATYYVMVQGNNTGGHLNQLVAGVMGTTKQTGQTFGTFATISTPPTTFTASVGPIATLY